MLVDTMRILKYGLANPVSKTVIKIGMKKANDDKFRLEIALDDFAQGKLEGGFADKAYSWFLKQILTFGCHAFHADLYTFKEYLRDPTIQRGCINVLSGIAKYGITKPQVLNAPFLIVWNFTNLCNLKCKHCYQYAGKEIPNSNELQLDEKLELVDKLAKSKIVSIAFSGGEPLIHPDFFPVLKEVKKKGMYAAIATNGTLITEEMAKRLKDEGADYVEISLDFPRPDLHDEFRGLSGAFEQAINGIKNCVNQDMFTCIATTITRANIEYVPDIIQLGRELKVDRFIHFNFIPSGRGKEIVGLDLTPAEREELLKFLFKESKKSGMQILSTAPQFARVVLQESYGNIIAPTHFYTETDSKLDFKVLAEFIGGCGAGRLYGAIQPNGDVTPCVFIPQLKIGNIRRESFIEIWNNNKILKEFRNRDILGQNCKTCEYKYVCGGCRARALSYFGDYLECDIGCIRNNEKRTILKKSVIIAQ